MPLERRELRLVMAKDQKHNILSYIEKGGSYEYGCSLFLSVTNNKVLAARLMMSNSLSNQETLKYELTKYLHSQPNYWESYISGDFDTELIPEDSSNGRGLNTDFGFHDFITPPDEPQNNDIRTRILEARKELYRDRGHLHGRLHQAETDEQRYEIQKMMVTVQGKINQFNTDLDKIAIGETPEKYLQATTTVDDYKTRANYQKYIRRYTQKLTETTDTNQIRKYQSKIDEYNKKLEV